MLSPWQRAMQARAIHRIAAENNRREAVARQRFRIAQRQMAQEIAHPPAVPAGYDETRRLLDMLAAPITGDVDTDLPPPDGWDIDLSPDQMYWEAEREMEAWDSFVKELRSKGGKNRES